jgi:hypothetical protein
MRAVPEVPETENAPEAGRASRRQRRAEAVAAPVSASLDSGGRPLAVFAALALSALIALSGYADPSLVALSVALGGLVLAWGWPGLLGLPSRRGTTTVLAIATVTCVLASALPTTDPFLRWLPAAVAASLIAAFLHQLLRRDGRPRLTESIAASAAGLAVITSGVAYIPLPRTFGGAEPLAAAMAALGLSAVADLLTGSRRLRPWALPIAMALGGAGAVAVAAVAGRPQFAAAALVGVLAAAVAHALRRILAVLPSMASARSQLVSGAASVLVCGVVVYVVSRLVVA